MLGSSWTLVPAPLSCPTSLYQVLSVVVVPFFCRFVVAFVTDNTDPAVVRCA